MLAVRRRRPRSLAWSPRIAGSLAQPAAHAEGQLRIAEQFGIIYLLLNVAQDQKLIEKHGKALGVDVHGRVGCKLSGGASINEALLSGSIDIARRGRRPDADDLGSHARPAEREGASRRSATCRTTWSPTIRP